MDENQQSIKQKKIALAQNPDAMVIIELMKDCLSKQELIAKTEWQTIVNAVTLDVESTMLRRMVDLIDSIKKGSLHEPK